MHKPTTKIHIDGVRPLKRHFKVEGMLNEQEASWSFLKSSFQNWIDKSGQRLIWKRESDGSETITGEMGWDDFYLDFIEVEVQMKKFIAEGLADGSIFTKFNAVPVYTIFDHAGKLLSC